MAPLGFLSPGELEKHTDACAEAEPGSLSPHPREGWAEVTLTEVRGRLLIVTEAEEGESGERGKRCRPFWPHLDQQEE
ncbi:Hypothetical predicted protein [Podarcis lilfordi]|uniref:Uncharacterized protein n=1 Tax=Podarcis lilfordi TaxID=74358 RepID=A0AA35PSA8_9SAUR|nr:Hypothetical predicted protein [Podarcis lilfordi]